MRFLKRIVLSTAMLLLGSGLVQGANFSWTGTVSADWFNTNNWTPVGVPASSDTINFDTGTINLTAPVTINGQFNWSGGTLSGSALTIASNAVLSLSGSNNKFLLNVLTNAGTVTWTGSGNLYVYNDNSSLRGAIYNLAGALFDIQNDQGLACACYGYEFFSNAGTLRKSAGTGTTTISTPFYNSGLVTVQQGALNFSNGGTVEGTFNAAAGTTIGFSGGSFSYSTAPTLNGPGTIQFTGGSLTLLDDLIPNLQLVGGTLSLGTNFQGGTITNLTFGGTLSGNYTVSGTFNCGGGVAGSLQVLSGATLNWSGGTAAGPVTIASNAVLSLSGSNNKFLLNVLTNAGTVTWTGSGNLYVYNDNSSLRGAIYNLAGALFDIQNDQGLACACYGYEFFSNAGTLRKSAGTGTTTISTPFFNSGLVTVQQGALNFSNGGTVEGTFSAAGGTTISFSGGSFSYSTAPTLNGPGTIQFTGGSLTLLDNLRLG